VNSDTPNIDRLLTELPANYQRLSRLGLYGDFFTFYFCDLQLKVNGPDGNPVYIKFFAKPIGRCSPL
jgi:phospholipid/cholesterol/gamma-HCH transport system substrate-binding protein